MKLNEEKITYCDYELLEKISKDLSLDYSIATHSVFVNVTSINHLPASLRTKEKITHEDISRNIMKKGLHIDEHYLDVFRTTWGYGYLKRILENDMKRKSLFIKYNYWKETRVNNIIIAIPPKIRLDGKEYFVGVLETDAYSIGHGFPDGNNILNSMLLAHKIPSEFIYGFYSRNASVGEILFGTTLESFKDKKVFQLETNPNHISKLSEEKQESFYQNLIVEKGVPKKMLQAVEKKKHLSRNPVINTTIGQKQAYENEFHGRGK